MPFTEITHGRNRGKYRSPSGRVFTRKQVRLYYARGQSFDAAAPVFHCDAIVSRRDPTGTGDIRRRGTTEFRRRWNAVARAARDVIVTHDILGLRPASAGAVALAASTVRSPSDIGHSAFSTLAGESKLKAFQSWVDQTLQQVVLGGDGAWLRDMVARSYARAVARGTRLTKSENRPQDSDARIAAIHALAVVETQGIMEAVSQRAVRSVAAAIIAGKSQMAIVADIAQATRAVGLTRSRAMVEDVVAKAFTAGTVDQFRTAGVARAGLIPEFVVKQTSGARDGIHDAPRRAAVSGPGSRGGTSGRTQRRIRGVEQRLRSTLGEYASIQTAGDDQVCEICEGLESGGPYTLDHALSLIPAHPYCRCALVPESAPDASSEE